MKTVKISGVRNVKEQLLALSVSEDEAKWVRGAIVFALLDGGHFPSIQLLSAAGMSRLSTPRAVSSYYQAMQKAVEAGKAKRPVLGRSFQIPEESFSVFWENTTAYRAHEKARIRSAEKRRLLRELSSSNKSSVKTESSVHVSTVADNIGVAIRNLEIAKKKSTDADSIASIQVAIISANAALQSVPKPRARRSAKK